MVRQLVYSVFFSGTSSNGKSNAKDLGDKSEAWLGDVTTCDEDRPKRPTWSMSLMGSFRREENGNRQGPADFSSKGLGRGGAERGGRVDESRTEAEDAGRPVGHLGDTGLILTSSFLVRRIALRAAAMHSRLRQPTVLYVYYSLLQWKLSNDQFLLTFLLVIFYSHLFFFRTLPLQHHSLSIEIFSTGSNSRKPELLKFQR